MFYNENTFSSRIIMLSYKDQGELISCVKDTHYLINWFKYYEAKTSLTFYIINKVILNDQVNVIVLIVAVLSCPNNTLKQVEIKTEHNVNMVLYIDYVLQDEEVNYLRNKVVNDNSNWNERS